MDLLRVLCWMNAHHVPVELHRWNGVFWQAHCPHCQREVWFDDSAGWINAPSETPR